MDDSSPQWPEQEKRARRLRILRRCAGVLLILSFPWLGCLSVFLVVLGSVLLAPDVISYFSRFAGNVLWSNREGRREPAYSIAEALAAKGKYEHCSRPKRTRR